MRQWKSWLVFILMIVIIPFARAESPAGNWTTIDDATGKKRAVIKISVSGGVLTGTVAKIYPQPGDSGVCEKCPDGFKNKPILGMQIIWGLKDDGKGQWSGGNILDPKSGKVYRAKITVDGNKLKVRGFIGFSLLGRTQTWVK
jgi:uncharacterized protein (DUF2147 family)